jgi:hypothetical protein
LWFGNATEKSNRRDGCNNVLNGAGVQTNCCGGGHIQRLFAARLTNARKE